MCLFFVFSIDFVLNYKTSNVDICAQIQYKANTFNKSEVQDKLEKKRSVHHPAACVSVFLPFGPRPPLKTWFQERRVFTKTPGIPHIKATSAANRDAPFWAQFSGCRWGGPGPQFPYIGKLCKNPIQMGNSRVGRGQRAAKHKLKKNKMLYKFFGPPGGGSGLPVLPEIFFLTKRENGVKTQYKHKHSKKNKNKKKLQKTLRVWVFLYVCDNFG